MFDPSGRVLALIIAGAAFIQPAMAQDAPDIEGAIIQGNQIADVIGATIRPATTAGSVTNDIDGEAGIYVMQVNEIFFVAASGGIGYSTNPVRTIDNLGDSFSANAGFSAGVRTRLGGAVDFGVVAGVSGVEYFEDFAPSSRNVNASAQAGTAIAGTPLYVNVAAFGGLNYDSKFSQGTAFYGGSASLSAGVALGPRTIVQPSIGGTRQWSQISENNSSSAAGGVNIVQIISSAMTVSLNGRITRTWFDDFYEDVTFVKRTDWSYGVGATASYRLSDRFNLSASGGYEWRDSTFILSNYESADASVLISFAYRF